MGIMRVISHRKSIMCPMGEQQSARTACGWCGSSFGEIDIPVNNAIQHYLLIVFPTETIGARFLSLLRGLKKIYEARFATNCN